MEAPLRIHRSKLETGLGHGEQALTEPDASTTIDPMLLTEGLRMNGSLVNHPGTIADRDGPDPDDHVAI